MKQNRQLSEGRRARRSFTPEFKAGAARAIRSQEFDRTRAFVVVLAIFGFLLSACGRHGSRHESSARTLPVPSHGPVHLGPYEMELPPWWNEVRVEVPSRLSDPNEFEEWQHEVMGRDHGSHRRRNDWREIVKQYVVAGVSQPRDLEFPVFLGHFLVAGDQWSDAAKLFGDLQALAATQGDDADWFRVYLAYDAGLAALFAGDNDLARQWFTRAVPFARDADRDIAYYASRSIEKSSELSVAETPPPGTVGTQIAIDGFRELPLTDRPVAIAGSTIQMRPLRGSWLDPSAPLGESRLVLARGRYRFITEVVPVAGADLETLGRTWALEHGGRPEVFATPVEGSTSAIVVTLSDSVGFARATAAGALFVRTTDRVWRVSYRLEGDDQYGHRECEDLVRRLTQHVRVVADTERRP